MSDRPKGIHEADAPEVSKLTDRALLRKIRQVHSPRVSETLRAEAKRRGIL